MVRDKSLSYYQRLKKFGLTSLETRRLRGDLIEVFKIFKGFDNVNYSQCFSLSSTGLRGHEFKLHKPHIHLDSLNIFFSFRVIDEWNGLPTTVINSHTVETFKKKLEPVFYESRMQISFKLLSGGS